MEQTIQIINRVLPILFLIFLGYGIRRKDWLAGTTIEELRKIVVNLALPAVLFTSFLTVDLKWSYMVIFAVVFPLCIALFLLGTLIRKQFRIRYATYPFLITGFEYGMLGISLFGAAYGLEKIGYIAVVDLGHEIFIWFVFLPLLLVNRDGVQRPGEIIKAFLTAPVVVAILTGIFLNLMGVGTNLHQLPVTGAVMITFDFLGKLTVPLILIIVGYGIKLDRKGLREALLVVMLRLGILVPLVILLNNVLLKGILHLDPLFTFALFTLFILPPPFIVPLYASPSLDLDEKEFINNVLTIHTIISVTVFLIYFMMHPL